MSVGILEFQFLKMIKVPKTLAQKNQHFFMLKNKFSTEHDISKQRYINN